MSNNKVVPEMNYSPIWESSCRPLFIKSVWLDSGHRHFLLDYKPKYKSEICTIQQNKCESDQKTVLSNSPVLNNDFLLFGLSKTHCQHGLTPIALSKRSCRRFSSRNAAVDQFRWKYDIYGEVKTTKGNSPLSSRNNSEEKLADRVLNWLDLAGKSPLTKPPPVVLKPSEKRKYKGVRSISKLPEINYTKSSDSVKPITIIFTKEGVPLRLDRPVRNINLCASTSSAGVLKRLTGNLVSSRLYEDNTISERESNDTLACAATRLRKTHSYAQNTRGGTELKSNSMQKENLFIKDIKKQLHIFMPSLPKTH